MLKDFSPRGRAREARRPVAEGDGRPQLRDQRFKGAAEACASARRASFILASARAAPVAVTLRPTATRSPTRARGGSDTEQLRRAALTRAAAATIATNLRVSIALMP